MERRVIKFRDLHNDTMEVSLYEDGDVVFETEGGGQVVLSDSEVKRLIKFLQDPV